MQPITDFDERFQILRSLVTRNELPEDWYTNDAYSVSFKGSDEHISKVTVTIHRQDIVIEREYKPVKRAPEGDSGSLYMLKTSETQRDTVESQG